MAFKQDDDYNTVAERITEFRDKYPEGSLQPLDITNPYDFRIINGKESVVVVAAAYRTPDDPRPGIGMAYEPIPGSTPFTRGSELQNAETAAWGRALIAVGAADARKGIASREDVMNAREREQTYDQRPPQQSRPQVQPDAPDEDDAERKAALDKLIAGINSLEQADRAEYQSRWQTNELPKLKNLTNDQYAKAVFLLKTLKGEIAQRVIAQDTPPSNPAQAPDYDAPPADLYAQTGPAQPGFYGNQSEYMTGADHA